jgi:hypothetical protein
MDVRDHYRLVMVNHQVVDRTGLVDSLFEESGVVVGLLVVYIVVG